MYEHSCLSTAPCRYCLTLCYFFTYRHISLIVLHIIKGDYPGCCHTDRSCCSIYIGSIEDVVTTHRYICPNYIYYLTASIYHQSNTSWHIQSNIPASIFPGLVLLSSLQLSLNEYFISQIPASPLPNCTQRPRLHTHYHTSSNKSVTYTSLNSLL